MGGHLVIARLVQTDTLGEESWIGDRSILGSYQTHDYKSLSKFPSETLQLLAVGVTVSL